MLAILMSFYSATKYNVWPPMISNESIYACGTLGFTFFKNKDNSSKITRKYCTKFGRRFIAKACETGFIVNELRREWDRTLPI